MKEEIGDPHEGLPDRLVLYPDLMETNPAQRIGFGWR